MIPGDLRRQVALGEVALSPDGELVAYTRRTTAGQRPCAIWLVAYGGGRAASAHRRHRRGPLAALLARRPDAGLPVRPRGRPHLYVIDVDGGEATPVTDAALPRGVAAFDWIPTGAGWWCWPTTRAREVVGERCRQADSPRDPPSRLALRRPRPELHQPPACRAALRRGAAAAHGGPWSAAQPRVSPDGRTVASSPTSTPTPTVACAPASTHRRRRAAPAGRADRGTSRPTTYEADGSLLARARERFPHSDHDHARLYRVGQRPAGVGAARARNSKTTSEGRPTASFLHLRGRRRPAHWRHDRRQRTMPDAAGA